MANSEEDDDAYLYGSDDEDQPSTKKQKTQASELTTLLLNDGDATKATGVAKDEDKAAVNEEENEDEEESEDDDEDDEDDDDDDIDIIIGDTAPKPSVPGNDILSEVAAPTSSAGTPQASTSTTTQITTKSSTGVTSATSKLDINANPEYEGKPLTQLDLEIFKIKPWRAPGADISDYFNFGFDEFTWNAYCHKQDKLRGEFNPQKIMAEIMKGPGGPLPGTEVGKNKNSPLPGGNNGLPQPPMGMFPRACLPHLVCSRLISNALWNANATRCANAS